MSKLSELEIIELVKRRRHQMEQENDKYLEAWMERVWAGDKARYGIDVADDVKPDQIAGGPGDE